MRTIALPLLAAAALSGVAASPALANETRAEARAGVQWLPGQTEATAGVAAGYDFDLGPMAFSGVEVSADKALGSGYKTSFGFHGRAGVNLAGTKLYGVGGYTTEPCDNCRGGWDLGAGAQMALMGPLYGKVEYKHQFVDQSRDRDTLLAGVGIRF
ncbi:outer membrane beta-barrel protein [Novosphingobium flavum]|uniref:Outer membrane beta-barrel protein n=1 Tax=Novosphingobium aerophilum TaxID=2839843 RepID=A0A7X1F8V2_9SPHN|nr:MULTISPECIES: outer membrane beta-barrel protein [Novosphingobium]MBC2652511.1 outer membrane beta-barrel protein [Novosphingobium aerophilum]MBC2662617.1 outer membrane beta-barrel protein [Novosphingobium aerophilum]